MNGATLSKFPSDSKPPAWSELAVRFADERKCLAAYLALECAEVVAGVKPGNLVNLVDRKRPCGRNPYQLWLEHGPALLASTNLEVIRFADYGNASLLYLYRRDLLQQVLNRKAVAVILKKCGYNGLDDHEAILNQLRVRMSSRPFPHEIGIFLGYPLKDVLAFMGHINLPFTCQGLWKIYGNPRESLQLAEQYRECRCTMARHLTLCSDPQQCLQIAA